MLFTGDFDFLLRNLILNHVDAGFHWIALAADPLKADVQAIDVCVQNFVKSIKHPIWLNSSAITRLW